MRWVLCLRKEDCVDEQASVGGVLDVKRGRTCQKQRNPKMNDEKKCQYANLKEYYYFTVNKKHKIYTNVEPN